MPFIADIPPPFKHQEETRDFIIGRKRVLIFSDPGTGKTRAVLDAFQTHRTAGGGKGLAIAPKAILEPSWLADARKFTPNLRVSIAHASNRLKAFKADADLYVTNHDAVRWLVQHKEVLAGFDFLAVDESTAFKNRTAQRSKALRELVKLFTDIRVCMTGTPIPKSVLDIWHQALLIDDGERLGKSFFHFRGAVCEPRQVGPRPEHLDWIDKEGAGEIVADLLRDITIRHRLEDCLDMPERVLNVIEFELPPALRRRYSDMREQAIIELGKANVKGVNEVSIRAKLCQIASGAVYDGSGEYHVLDTSRYELVSELCAQRKHTVVAFLWRHQRDQLMRALESIGRTFAVIDGETRSKDLPRIIERFQAGEIDDLLAHPQSASHGLTLTKATTLIWPSPPPTEDAERFEQFGRRIYRAGQTERTETLLIEAPDTLEGHLYARVQGKITKQLNLLDVLQNLIKEAA